MRKNFGFQALSMFTLHKWAYKVTKSGHCILNKYNQRPRVKVYKVQVRLPDPTPLTHIHIHRYSQQTWHTLPLHDDKKCHKTGYFLY